MNTVLCLHASSLKQTLICRHILQSRECYSIFIEKSANKQGSPNHDSIPKKKDAGYRAPCSFAWQFSPYSTKAQNQDGVLLYIIVRHHYLDTLR